MLHHSIVTLRNTRTPGTSIASLRCASRASTVASCASCGINSVASLQHLRRVSILQGETIVSHRLQAFRDSCVGLAFRTGTSQLFLRHILHQQNDANNGNSEETYNGSNQLLRRSDSGFVAHDFLRTVFQSCGRVDFLTSSTPYPRQTCDYRRKPLAMEWISGYPSCLFSISIAAVAQWIEYRPPKPRVVGSIPASRASFSLPRLSVFPRL